MTGAELQKFTEKYCFARSYPKQNWVRAMPSTATILSRSNRMDERLRVGSKAGCRRAGHSEEVQIVDFSPRGVRIRFLTNFRAGEAIWLRLPLLEALEARVVWVRNQEAGCRLVVPLHPAIFAVVSRALAAE